MKTTEQNSYYAHLDEMSLEELLIGINTEDRRTPEAVRKAIPQVQKLVEGIVERGGRVFYMGAGTSGRLGVIDAAEIPPTYGVDGKFIGIIAGGDGAFRTAVEGAEDDREQGWKDLLAFQPGPNDTLVGISASGSAPYVAGAICEAKRHGLLTACISCNEQSEISELCDIPVIAVVGPEFVTGSTRMKSASAAKLILNMISTSVMILEGHVKGCKMVDMQLTNKKLVDRGTRMIMEETGEQDYEKAKALLLRYGQVRAAVEAYKKQKQ